MTDSEKWWRWVTGPKRFIDDICDLLINGGSSIICIDCDTPWRNDIRLFVERELTHTNRVVMYIDIEEEYNLDDIGEFLMNRVNNDKALNYRKHKEQPETFIKSNKLFGNKIIWLKGIPYDKVNKFEKYFKKWIPENGQLVIEVTSNTKQRPSYKSTPRMKRFDDISYISVADTKLMLHILNRELGNGGLLEEYSSALLTNLCKNDAELAAHMLTNINLCRDNPVDVIKNLLKNDFKGTMKGTTTKENDEHPFYLIRNNCIEVINTRIRKAQTSSFLSKIEEIRINFLRDNQETLKKFCPSFDKYGYKIETIYDMDITFLVYFIETSKKQMIKNFKNMNSYKTINNLKEVRNKLAHACILKPEEVKILLDL